MSRNTAAWLCIACSFAACARTPVAPARTAASGPCDRAHLRSGFEVINPTAAGLDPVALRALLEHAKTSDSDAVVILRDGKVAVEEYFGRGPRPIMAMSASKSVASLAIAALEMRDPSFSLDERVSATFPAWTSDPAKARVTVRQLMNQTSGIALAKRPWDTMMSGNVRSIEDAMANAPMRHEPGADFRYNNAAVDFLSVLVFAKTKLRLDDLLQRDVFGPIGLRGAYWNKDVYGHPMAAAELVLEPLELAKLGQLMLQDGIWDGKRILPEGWVAEVTRPSQPFNERYGELWWVDAKLSVFITDELLADWRTAGVPTSTIDKVRTLVGQAYDSRDACASALSKVLSAGEKAALDETLGSYGIESYRIKLAGPVRGFAATGWLGQRLVVLPNSRVVAVRMHARRDGDEQGPKETRVSYVDFTRDVRALVGDRD